MRRGCAWRPTARTLAAVLVAAGVSERAPQAAPSQSATTGPVEVSARGVEFRKYDETSGALRAHLFADSVSMAGAEAKLERARLARYDGAGRLLLEVRAAKGSYAGGRGARLRGGVEIQWYLEGGTAQFRCDDIVWDETSDSFRTDSAVHGRVLRRGPRASSVLKLEGRGFAFVTAESRGEIVRDAVVRTDSQRGTGFRATADGGLVFASTREGGGPGPHPRPCALTAGAGGLVIGMRGPVATASRGSSARADGLVLRFAAAEGGELDLESGTFSGTVRAFVSQGDEEREGAGGLLPGSFVPRLLVKKTIWQRKPGPEARRIELRAEVIEVITAPRVMVLYGTLTEPARVIFHGGELRGTRIDLTEARITTDGGAPSEFIW